MGHSGAHTLDESVDGGRDDGSNNRQYQTHQKSRSCELSEARV